MLMQSMTIEQLRVASNAGGISGVTLKGKGGAFFVQIDTCNGTAALLAKARSSEPRRFGNPISALNVLRDVGITIGQFDASEWNPAEKEELSGNRGRADAMRSAHQAAAYSTWLAAEIQAAVDDPRANFSHDEVMAELEADITDLENQHKQMNMARTVTD
ncbi:MAG: hypothetical protein ACK5NY_08255 [Burkholderiaceae bacterium]